jgi:fucose permease
MLGVCLFAFGMVAVEMGNRQWGAIFLHDVFDQPTAVAGVGPLAFAAAMALGRLLGDRLAARFGPVALARSATLIAIAGVAVFVGGVSLPVSVAGLAAAGLGVSVAFPLAVTAVANRGDRPPPVNVGAFQIFTSVSSLLIPPLVGKVAETAGLRIGFAMLLPLLAVSLWTTGELGRGDAAFADGVAGAGAER